MVAPMVLRDLVRVLPDLRGRTVGELCRWQGMAGVAQERERAAYFRSKGKPFDDFPWHDLGGIEVPAHLREPLPQPHAQCRSCGGPIRWTVTKEGRKMPINLDGVSHFATCPNAKEWRHG